MTEPAQAVCRTHGACEHGKNFCDTRSLCLPCEEILNDYGDQQARRPCVYTDQPPCPFCDEPWAGHDKDCPLGRRLQVPTEPPATTARLSVPSFDNQGEARVGHGADCVFIQITGPRAGSIILHSVDAHELGCLLIEQARHARAITATSDGSRRG